MDSEKIEVRINGSKVTTLNVFLQHSMYFYNTQCIFTTSTFALPLEVITLDKEINMQLFKNFTNSKSFRY